MGWSARGGSHPESIDTSPHACGDEEGGNGASHEHPDQHWKTPTPSTFYRQFFTPRSFLDDERESSTLKKSVLSLGRSVVALLLVALSYVSASYVNSLSSTQPKAVKKTQSSHKTKVFVRNTYPCLEHMKRAAVNSSKDQGKCPELIEAAKFVVQQEQNSFEWRVGMIQLVGSWETQEDEDVMYRVFDHNARVLERHGIPSIPISQPINPAHASIPPAYWKVDAVLHHCSTGNNPEILWFLDGDALVMDPHARVDFLWAYHNHLARLEGNDLDILFAHDWNSFNTGIFVVNCTSPTAVKTLQIWQQLAMDLLDRGEHVHRLWYEQNALHCLLDTPRWREANGTKWNRAINKYVPKSERSVFSTAGMRKRLRHTTHCALNTYPTDHGHPQDRTNHVYNPGHFILHCAGMSKPKSRKFDLLRNYSALKSWSDCTFDIRGAAEAYLKAHPYEYDYNQTYLDWF